MTFECFVWSSNSENQALEGIEVVGSEIRAIALFLEKKVLKKIRNGTPGLRLYLVDKKENEHLDKPIKGVISWVNFFMYFDFERYLNLPDNLEKKKMIVAMLKEGAERASEIMKWDIEPFNEAFHQIETLNYSFVNTSTRKRFKGVKRYVHLERVVDIGFYNFYLVVKEKDEIISRHKVVTLNQYYNIFFESNRIISEMRWEDENTFAILGKKGHLERIRFEYKFDTDT